MKLAVIGSREFGSLKLMEQELELYLLTTTLLISGGARGADRLAETWAKKHGIEKKIFYPNHKEHRDPYHHRNRLIAEACDEMVAFWDGVSTGTAYTIDYADGIGKDVTIVRF